MKSLACLFIALGVVAGAFGAHGLKDVVAPERLEVFKTAVFYQIAMSIVLFILSSEANIETWVLKVLFSGILVFSGSLYVLVLANLPIMGAVTPIGGTLIITSLICASWKLYWASHS